MFHRFQLRYGWEELVQWAKIDPASLPVMPSKDQLKSGRFHPVIRMSKVTGKRELVWMREGLIPSYACDERGAELRVEAHAEAMTCDACFRSAFRRRRCLVPANSLLERRHLSAGIEQPCSFQLETGELFGIAAVWETWTNDQGHSVNSFAIVTTLVIPTLRTLFDRMPVVLTDLREQERWLQASEDHEYPPADLLRPLSIAQLHQWRMTPGDVDLQLQPVRHSAQASAQ
jgi:putative SOS response-associated peptidase YedK